MKRKLSIIGLSALAFISAWLLCWLIHIPSQLIPRMINRPIGSFKPNNSYGNLPLYFELNQGQTDPQVKFRARGSGYNLFLTSKEMVLVLNQTIKNPRGSLGPFRLSGQKSKHTQSPLAAILRLNLVGANPDPKVEGMKKLPGISNYFIGKNPSKWRIGIPQYSKVRLKDIYPGIDMVYYGNQGRLEYDFVVAPGADPKVIRLALSKTNESFLDPNGNLSVKAGERNLTFKAPFVYQMRNGKKELIEGRYVLAEDQKIGFDVHQYDISKPLVIDPVLDYSTYLGGKESGGNGIAVDSDGNAYITGYASNPDFPTTSGAYQTIGSSLGYNAVISKLNSTGTALIYSTYLGGNGEETSNAIVIDSSGNAYVGGNTTSTDFPTTAGAFETDQDGIGLSSGVTSYGTASNAFVTKLNSTGTSLIYSTYLGGSAFDVVWAIAVDASGNAYVTGQTDDNFPTTSGAYQSTYLSFNPSVFVTKLNATGTGLIYSTLLCGNDRKSANGIGTGITIDAGGNAYVTGSTGNDPDFPTTSGAYQKNLKGSANAFVTKLNPTGTALIYSTYLGGSNTDQPNKISLDSDGNAYLCGQTRSTDFPTTSGAYQTTLKGTTNAFLTKLNPTGSALIFSTYLGGGNSDQGDEIAVDPNGNVFMSGLTNSIDFPITSNAYQTALAEPNDAFLTKVNNTGSRLLYSTYFGRSVILYALRGTGISLDENENLYITGTTNSINFPTTNGSYQPLYQGLADYGTNAFVSKFEKTTFYTPTPTNTPTPSITNTATKTSTPTWTGTPTNTPTATQTPTFTSTPGYSGPNPPTPGTSFAYPSPASVGYVNIAFNMAEGGTAQVLVWNDAAELTTDSSENKWTGPQKITINTQGWAPGVYFYRVVLHYNSGRMEKLPPDKFFIRRR